MKFALTERQKESLMTDTTSANHICAISGKHTAPKALVSLRDLLPNLAERIVQDHSALTPTSQVSMAEVDRYRMLYVEDMLLAEHGELSDLDKQVAKSLHDHDTIAENVDETFGETMRFPDRVSDNLAKFGGSWKFLIGFAVVLLFWMLVNSFKWAFDPFPFIFLNLILSCLAAVQAPVILMSQRRSEEKDRLRAQSDYRVNLKAELEIRHLHEKLDHIISKQWQRLSEIQQLQLESMQMNKELYKPRRKPIPRKKK